MVDKIVTAALTPPGNLMRPDPAAPSKPSMPTSGQSFAAMLSEVGETAVANGNQSEKDGAEVDYQRCRTGRHRDRCFERGSHARYRNGAS